MQMILNMTHFVASKKKLSAAWTCGLLLRADTHSSPLHPPYYQLGHIPAEEESCLFELLFLLKTFQGGFSHAKCNAASRRGEEVDGRRGAGGDSLSDLNG